MSDRSLTPTTLRLILSATLIAGLAISGGAFYLAYQRLGTMATDVGTKVASANESRNTLQELQKLKQELEANQDVINRASRIAADGQNYAYQDQVVSDLTTYATRSGMEISNITFSAPEGASAAPGAAAAPTPADSAPSGLKTTTISITIKNPANYEGLLNFLHYIEQNLTKLKIANVTLTKAENGMVNTNVLSLEVYLR